MYLAHHELESVFIIIILLGVLTVQARVGASDMLEEAARWAKRNAKALKLARYALRHGGHQSVPKPKSKVHYWPLQNLF